MANASIGAPRVSQRPRLSDAQRAVLIVMRSKPRWESGHAIKEEMIARGFLTPHSPMAPFTVLKALRGKRLVDNALTSKAWMLTDFGRRVADELAKEAA